ncbi:MAG: hypothetical protein GY786_21560 [Proteobacteria bacterium]|nr:hypothetical protein [Pseudomonadota bacterium]
MYDNFKERLFYMGICICFTSLVGCVSMFATQYNKDDVANMSATQIKAACKHQREMQGSSRSISECFQPGRNPTYCQAAKREAAEISGKNMDILGCFSLGY